MVMENFYDSRYSKEEFYWGLKPHELVVELASCLQKDAKVLDLGSGEGKDSFYLAKKGFYVTAVDISKEGIKKTSEFAKKNNLKIQTFESDIMTFLNDCEKFDAIICLGVLNVLQFVNSKEIKDIIGQIKTKTNKGGFNVIASFIAPKEGVKKKVIEKGRYLFDEDELKKLYDDWEINFYEEKWGDWETHGEKPHRHYKVKLIAQKN